MKRIKCFFLFSFLLHGCMAKVDTVDLYNEGIRLWNEGNTSHALWHVKKAYVFDPCLKGVRKTYENMRLGFPQKPVAERVFLGIRGANTIAWIGVFFLMVAGGLLIVKTGAWTWLWLGYIQEWKFLRHVIVVTYVVGGVLLIFQAGVAVRLFFPEPAVVIGNGVLADRPENRAFEISRLSDGTEGWILRRDDEWVLFRTENGEEGWIHTNICRGLWR